MVSANTYFDIAEQTILDFEPKAEQEAFIEKLRTLFNEEDRNWSHMQYVQIVVGETGQEDTNVFGSVPYAALYALSDFRDSLGNQTLPGVNLLRKPLSKSVVATLQANGYICIVPSVRKNYVVAYPQNLADKAETPLHTFSNQRLLHEIGKTVGNRLDGYVGKPTTVFATSILVKELEIYFQNFVSKGILSGFELSFPESEQGIDSRYLDITLRVYDEIKQVGASFRIEENEWEADVWSLID